MSMVPTSFPSVPQASVPNHILQPSIIAEILLYLNGDDLPTMNNALIVSNEITIHYYYQN